MFPALGLMWGTQQGGKGTAHNMQLVILKGFYPNVGGVMRTRGSPGAETLPGRQEQPLQFQNGIGNGNGDWDGDGSGEQDWEWE